MMIEDDLVRDRRVDHVAARGVKHTLRLSRRPRRVQNEEWVLGASPLDRANRALLPALFVEPEVSPGDHVDLFVRPPGHQHAGHGIESVDGLIDGSLQGQPLAAAESFVGRDHELASSVEDTVTDRFGAEAAEHDGVDGADSRAGEHGVRELRDHRHVDADAIAAPHAVMKQHVRHAADFVLELPVRNPLVFARLVLRPDDRVLVSPFVDMAVDAVVAGVQPSTGKPSEVDVLVIAVENRMPFVKPGQRLGLLGPEPLGVVQREPIQTFVLGHRVDVCFVDDGRFRRIEIAVAVLMFLGHSDLPSSCEPGRSRARDDNGLHGMVRIGKTLT